MGVEGFQIQRREYVEDPEHWETLRLLVGYRVRLLADQFFVTDSYSLSRIPTAPAEVPNEGGPLQIDSFSSIRNVGVKLHNL